MPTAFDDLLVDAPNDQFDDLLVDEPVAKKAPSVQQEEPAQPLPETALNQLKRGFLDLAAKPVQFIANTQQAAIDLAGQAPVIGPAWKGALEMLPTPARTAAPFVQELAERRAEMSPVDPRNKITSTIAGAIPQAMGMISTGGVAGIPATLALGGMMGGQQGYETADEIGVTSPLGKLATAAAFGATEAAVERLGGIGAKDVVGSAVKKLVHGGLSEMVEEPITGIGQDAITRLAATDTGNGQTATGYDLSQLSPTDPRYWEKRGLETVGGAAGGTIFAGVQALGDLGKQQQETPVQQEVPQGPDDIDAEMQRIREAEQQVPEPVGTSIEDGQSIVPDLSAVEPPVPPPESVIPVVDQAALDAEAERRRIVNEEYLKAIEEKHQAQIEALPDEKLDDLIRKAQLSTNAAAVANDPSAEDEQEWLDRLRAEKVRRNPPPSQQVADAVATVDPAAAETGIQVAPATLAAVDDASKILETISEQAVVLPAAPTAAPAQESPPVAGAAPIQETEQEKARREYQEYVDREYRPTWGTTAEAETTTAAPVQDDRLTEAEMERLRVAASKGRLDEEVARMNQEPSKKVLTDASTPVTGGGMSTTKPRDYATGDPNTPFYFEDDSWKVDQDRLPNGSEAIETSDGPAVYSRQADGSVSAYGVNANGRHVYAGKSNNTFLPSEYAGVPLNEMFSALKGNRTYESDRAGDLFPALDQATAEKLVAKYPPTKRAEATRHPNLTPRARSYLIAVEDGQGRVSTRSEQRAIAEENGFTFKDGDSESFEKALKARAAELAAGPIGPMIDLSEPPPVTGGGMETPPSTSNKALQWAEPATGQITSNVADESDALRGAAIRGERITPEEAESLWNETEVIEYAWRQEFNSDSRRTGWQWDAGWDKANPQDALRKRAGDKQPAGRGDADFMASMMTADEYLAERNRNKPLVKSVDEILSTGGGMEKTTTQRDATKPEQMTPDEATERVWPPDKHTASAPDNGEATLNGMRAVKKDGVWHFDTQDGSKAPWQWISDPRTQAPLDHELIVKESLHLNKPVSAAAVEAYGIKLPAGYQKQGDLYVFQPETPSQPPQETAAQAAAETGIVAARSEEGGVSITVGSRDTVKAANPGITLGISRGEGGKRYTLWLKSSNTARRRWTYIRTLPDNKDEAIEAAKFTARQLASGQGIKTAFWGKDLSGEQVSKDAAAGIGVVDEELSSTDLNESAPAMPIAEQNVGFGKHSQLPVRDLFATDPGYAMWIYQSGTSSRAEAIKKYLETLPEFLSARDEEIARKTDEADRLRAYEERQKNRGKAAKPTNLDITNTTTDNVVENKKVEKLTERKAKDQIVDIIPPQQDVPNLVPAKLVPEMFPMQVSGANATINSMERNGFALNGDGAGVGKTRQILAVASYYAKQGKPVVIITENAAIGKPWEGAKGKTNPQLGGSMKKDGDAMGVTINLMPDNGSAENGGIYITTYNRVTKDQVPAGSVVIFDESQGLINIYDDLKEKLTQWQIKLQPIISNASKAAFYSATPADKPHQMAYLYKVLGFNSPDEFLDAAMKNGMIIRTRRFGKQETKLYDVPRSQAAKSKLYKWVNNLMKRAGKAGSFIKREISYEGTDVQFHDTVGTDESKNPWAERFNEVMAEMAAHANNGWRLLAPESYTLYAAELAKIGDAVKMVKRELASGRKAVVYFSRINEQEIRGRKMETGYDGEMMLSEPVVLGKIPSPVDLLREELKKEGIAFTELHSKSGDTSKTAQNKFAGDVDVLLASVESGGTGINLDDTTGKKPRTEVFMFAPYRGISTIQAMGRIWRASTIQNDNLPNRYVFIVASDIKQDAMRSAILAKKLQLMSASLGGTAVSRLPMSKVSYDPDQLVGIELPDEGEASQVGGGEEALSTEPLKPVKVKWNLAKSGRTWWTRNVPIDLLEWVENNGPERTGLDVSVKKDGGTYVAFAKGDYQPEQFAVELGDEIQEEEPKQPAPTPSAPSRESEAGAVATSPPGASPPVVAASTKETQKPEKATTSVKTVPFTVLRENIPGEKPKKVEVQIPVMVENGVETLTPEAHQIIDDAKWPDTPASPFHASYAEMDYEKYFSVWGDESNRDQVRANYRKLMERAASSKKPLSYEGWKFDMREPVPAGYQKQGELYIFQSSKPQETPQQEEPSKPPDASQRTSDTRTIKQGDKVKFKQEGVLQSGVFQGVNADGTYSVQVKGEKVPRHVSARSLNENNESQVEGTTTIPPKTLNPTIKRKKRGDAGFIDVEAISHGIELYARGVKDFASWSARMVKRFGEAVRTHLKSIYQSITKGGFTNEQQHRINQWRNKRREAIDSIEVAKDGGQEAARDFFKRYISALYGIGKNQDGSMSFRDYPGWARFKSLFTEDPTQRTGVTVSGDGTIMLNVGLFPESHVETGESVRLMAPFAADEEAIHMVEFAQSVNKANEAATRLILADSVEMLTQAKKAISEASANGNQNLADIIENAFVDSWNQYNNEVQVLSFDGIIKKLLDDPYQAVNVTGEFSRQLIQFGQIGDSTETAYQKLIGDAESLIAKSREALLAASTLARSGAMGGLLQAKIKETEVVLDGIKSQPKFALPVSQASMSKAKAQAFLDKAGIPRSKVRVIAEPSLRFKGRYDPSGEITLNASYLSDTDDLWDTLARHESIHDAVSTDPKVQAAADALLNTLTEEEAQDIEAAIGDYEDNQKHDERIVEAVRLMTASRPELQTAWGRFVEAVMLAIKKVLRIKNLDRRYAELSAARILARGLKRLRKGKTGGRTQGGGSLYGFAGDVEVGHFDPQMGRAREYISSAWDGSLGKVESRSGVDDTTYRVIDVVWNGESFEHLDGRSPTHRIWFNASNENGTNVDKLVKLGGKSNFSISPSDVTRFKQLTASIPPKPTPEQLETWKQEHPAEYKELEAMRERVLYEAGYEKKVKHATHKDFTVFDKSLGVGSNDAFEMDHWGIWTTSYTDDASIYGPKEMLLMGRLKKPKVFQNFEEWFQDYVRIAYPGFVSGDESLTAEELRNDLKEFAHKYYKLPRAMASGSGSKEYKAMLAEQPGAKAYEKHLKDAGFDGVLLEGGFLDGILQTTMVFLDSDQLKSADPLLLDDSGNLIPPDLWGDETSPDIRYASTNIPAAGSEDSQPLSPTDNSLRAREIREAAAGIDWGTATRSEKKAAVDAFGRKTLGRLRAGNIQPDATIVIASGDGESAHARFDGVIDGKTVVVIQNGYSGSVNLANAEQAMAHAYDSSHEEMIHALQSIAAVRRWKKAGSVGEAEDFVRNEAEDALSEIKAAFNEAKESGNAELASKIDALVVDSWNLYNRNKLPSLDAVIAEIEGGAGLSHQQFYSEVTRQLMQVSRNDFTTETGWQRFVTRVKALLETVINRLKDALNLAKKGTLGPTIKQEITDLETMMKDWESSNSKPLYSLPKPPTGRTRQRRVLARINETDLNPPTGTEVLGTVNPDGTMKDVLLGDDGKPVYVATSGIYDKETAERIIEASVPLIESIGLETVADILMNPQRLLDNGIVPNSALHQGVAMEAQFQANQRYLKDPKNPANQSLYDKTHNARERVGTEGGQSQGIRGALIGNERYQSMFITEALYDQIKKGLVRGFDTIMDAAEIATKIQEAVKRAEEAARADLDDMLTAINPDIPNDVDPSVYINTPAAQEKKTLAERMLEKDSPELLRLVNKIKGKVSWKEILGEPRQTMRERMAGIFDRVRKHEALQDLSPAEQETLTKELERLLQKQRLKQVNKDLNAAGLNLPKKAERVVREAIPELLRLINTGTFSAETFRDAIAPKFGLKTLSSEEVKRVEEIAAKIQDAPAGMPKRQLQNELLTTMQDITSATKSQIALQYWVSSVLSGGRTQFDTALSFLNGTRKFLQGASLAAMKGEGKVVGQAFQRYFKGLHDGMMEAAYYFRTGDPTMLLNFDAEMNAYLKGGQNEAHPYRLSEKIWNDAKKSGNWLKIPPAAVIMSVNRMMQSWDHINARATSRGFLPLAVAFNRKLYSDLKVPDQADFKAAEQQAEQFLGKPKTWGEKVKVKAMANEILDASVSEDNKVRDTIINEAIDIGRTASYQNDPTGIIGTLYHGIKNTTANIIKKAEAAAQEAGKTAAKTGTKSDKAKATAMNLVAFSSRFVEPIAGTMFLRFVGNRFNELISLTPGLGAMRLWEKEMNQTKRAMIYTDQAVGSILYALGAVALYAMLSDDDDEDKRGWRIEGGWQGVDKAKQRQMLSEGRTPYSLAFKNADGSWGTLKFGNWPVASILATVGGMSDKAKYRPKEWNEDSYAAHIANAIFGGITAISDISAISALMETLGGTQYGKDPVEGLRDRVNATMANFTGGFIPRGLKDLDYLSNPAHNKPDDLMSFWLKEIPVYRRSVGAPMMDVFGRQVQLRREPWSRAYLPGPIEPEYQIAGRMASRGLFLPLSDPDQRVVGKGKNRRSMTDEEKGQYLKEAGEAYKDFVLRYGEKVLDMEPEKAREFIASKLTEARNRAEQRAVR